MGAFYFQRDENLSTKAEILRIRRLTGLSAADVVFHLEEFWRYVNQLGHSLNDGSGAGVLPGYELADLPLLVGLTDTYWSAVVEVGWIKLGEHGELTIPGFDDRFGKLAQKRIAAAVRQQKSRANRAEQDAGSRDQPADTDSDNGATGPQDEALAAQVGAQVADEPAAVVASIDPPRPAGKQLASQFDLLNIADLSVCGKLLCWMADVAAMPRPVVLNDEWHQVRVIAAGIRATTGNGVKSPMALFKAIVGKRQWTKLEPSDIKAAQRKLSTYRQGRARMQAEYLERAGPGPVQVTAQSLIAGGFGGIPTEPRSPRGATQAMALLQFESERQQSRTG